MIFDFHPSYPCNSCDYVAVSLDNLFEHCVKEHPAYHEPLQEGEE